MIFELNIMRCTDIMTVAKERTISMIAPQSTIPTWKELKSSNLSKHLERDNIGWQLDVKEHTRRQCLEYCVVSSDLWERHHSTPSLPEMDDKKATLTETLW